MESKTHWEAVYGTKRATEVSWFQEHADTSLRLIHHAGTGSTEPIIDVGGGASTLVDDLLDDGYKDLTVLDISASALHTAQERLRNRAGEVTWLVSDVTVADLPRRHYAVWHDRAVFHFLVDEDQRRKYVDVMLQSVKPGGHIIVATFGPDGPQECSGLPVMRYDPESLHEQFGRDVEPVGYTIEEHHTPFGTVQQFLYFHCSKP